MFFKKPPSKDENYYLVEFVCKDEEDNLYNVFINGSPVSRIFIDEEKIHDIESEIKALIASGKLTVSHYRMKNIDSVMLSSTKRIGNLIRVELFTDNKLTVEGKTISKPLRNITPPKSIKMIPVSQREISREVRKYTKNQDFFDFAELLKSFNPMAEEKGITEFDGKTIHPISMKTIPSALRVYSKGFINRHKKESRTILLLDRSLSMANAWSTWEEISKIRIERFLARVIQTFQFNNHVFSFGKDLREEEDLFSIEATDEETRLELALKEVELHNPEKLIIITDARPVYSPKTSTEELCNECILMLDALSRSGVKILIILLGYDSEMFRFYQMLKENPDVSLIEISDEKRGFVKMLYKLSDYISK